MHTLLRRLLLLFLVISLTPGWVELVENLEHLVHDGHIAHLVGHEEQEPSARHDALEAEHGCTPVSHTCPCHSSVPAVLPDEVELEILAGGELPIHFALQPERGAWRALAPPSPPPRA